jgi:hypothetical protein
MRRRPPNSSTADKEIPENQYQAKARALCLQAHTLNCQYIWSSLVVEPQAIRAVRSTSHMSIRVHRVHQCVYLCTVLLHDIDPIPQVVCMNKPAGYLKADRSWKESLKQGLIT